MNEIIEKRRRLRREFLASAAGSYTKAGIVACDRDLELLFRLYDGIFLEDYFKDSYRGTCRFCFSRRLRTSAGITKLPKYPRRLRPEQQWLEIRVSADFLSRFNKVEREARVNGLVPDDALEALLFIFEHEICHVLEFMRFGRTSCRGKRFLELAHTLFGHTGTTHALPTAGEVAQKETGLAPGSRVSFVYQGKVLTGVVNYVGKKAAVMVRDVRGRYKDRRGNHYTKYYVALQRLKI